MRRVDPHQLWIGHRGDLRDPRSLGAAGISLLVDLAIDEPLPGVSRERAFARFPLYDGGGNEPWIIRAAIETAVHALRNGQTVMIACSAGMSRSPAIAAAVLSVFTGRPPQDCLVEVARGKADVSPALWAQVLAALGDAPPPDSRPLLD